MDHVIADAVIAGFGISVLVVGAILWLEFRKLGDLIKSYHATLSENDAGIKARESEVAYLRAIVNAGAQARVSAQSRIADHAESDPGDAPVHHGRYPMVTTTGPISDVQPGRREPLKMDHGA